MAKTGESIKKAIIIAKAPSRAILFHDREFGNDATHNAPEKASEIQKVDCNF
jgi:hypothetical protein